MRLSPFALIEQPQIEVDARAHRDGDQGGKRNCRWLDERWLILERLDDESDNVCYRRNGEIQERVTEELAAYS